MNDFNSSSLEKHTPMMQQYLEIKEKAKDLILLYRLGDFYEMFFDDAKQASKLLNLTLTKRGFFNKKPIPMAGIPVNSLDQYLAKFLDKGMSIAICEQTGEINIHNKGPIERKIVKIITPGTLTDDSLLPSKSDRLILSIYNAKHSTGISYLNLANGEFYVLECKPHELETEIYRLDPAEILISENHKLDFLYAARISKIPSYNYDIKNATQELLNHFKIDTINCFDIQNMINAICAAGALIKYVAQTQFTHLTHIKNIKIEKNNEYIILNPETRKNLELIKSIKGSDDLTLFAIIDNCYTSMGSRTLKKWLQNPIRNIKVLKERQEAINTLYFYISNEKENKKHNFLKQLKIFPDLERISSRISMKSAKPKEVSSLRDALSVLPIISKQLNSLVEQSSLLNNINNFLYIDNNLLLLLNKSIVDEPSNSLKEGNIILPGFDEELDQLRDIYQNSHVHLSQIEEKERKNTGINNLRIEFNRIHGFYIEVSKGQIHKIPKYYFRKQTLKNAERYVTDELKNLENEILSAQEKSLRREKLLYDNLLSEIDKYYDNLYNCSQSIAQIDVLLNLAIHAYNNNWHLPIISEKIEIIIKDGRHPVVENNLECFIPNSCELNYDNRMFIITGPNMGGKSTYMRQIALISILAKIGSFVPAKSATIGDIDRIFTRIGANDDISSGRSTFMVEMTEAASILRSSTQNSLILMDEIGRGTSTYDGLSLAWSIAMTLLNINQSLTLFSTHYFELTDLAKEFPNVLNVHLTIAEESDNIIFLHEVKKGTCNKSYGIHVAKKAGIPIDVLKLATNKLEILEKNKKQTNNIVHKSIIENITNLDIDNITGLEALNVLHKFKNKIKSIN